MSSENETLAVQDVFHFNFIFWKILKFLSFIQKQIKSKRQMSNLLLNGTSTVTFYKLKGKITAQTEELLIELQ